MFCGGLRQEWRHKPALLYEYWSHGECSFFFSNNDFSIVFESMVLGPRVHKIVSVCEGCYHFHLKSLQPSTRIISLQPLREETIRLQSGFDFKCIHTEIRLLRLLQPICFGPLLSSGFSLPLWSIKLHKFILYLKWGGHTKQTATWAEFAKVKYRPFRNYLWQVLL